MNAVLDQLKINLRHTISCRDSCEPLCGFGLWRYYNGKAVAYQHAIDLLQGMIEHEEERCKSK